LKHQANDDGEDTAVNRLFARLFKKKDTMTDISILGTGNMAKALAARAIAAGRTLQIQARDEAKAAALAAELGHGVTSAALSEAPAGRLVIAALPFDAIVEYAKAQGAALAGKVLVDLSNPVDFSTFDALTVPADSSAAQIIAAASAAPVVKAFNTTFAGPLAAGEGQGAPLDVFVAADDAEAAALVSAFIADAGLRALPVGGLHHARELEGMQLLVMAMQVNEALPAFQWGTALKVLG
jgi:predicted dinucleotide-binding enzyme